MTSKVVSGAPRTGRPGRDRAGSRLNWTGRPRSRLRQHYRTWLFCYAFVAPCAILTGIFSLLPLGMLFYRSLYAGNVFGTNVKFVGLANYGAALADGGVHALVVTVIFTVGFVVLSMGFGLGVALLLDVRLPGLSRLRAPFIVPLVVPVVASGLIWSSLFAPQFGFVNRILTALGLPAVNWLSSSTMALVMVILFSVWQFFGENVILYLAALKTIPGELLEAAKIDGAGTWQTFRRVRWPLLRYSTALIWVITTLTGLQTFTQIYILTNGGPDGATQTLLYYVYNEAFVQNNVGNADAMGVILFLLSLLIAVVQIGIISRSVRRGVF